MQVHTIAMVEPTPWFELQINAFLAEHASGYVLIDTGMDPRAAAIGKGLATFGASWADISDIVLTHAHADHIGGLISIRGNAPHATIHASALDHYGILHRDIADGDYVRGLRVIATPGHTAGHLSMLSEDGTLFVGDLLGTMFGSLTRAPEQFTADAKVAERSIHRVAHLGAARMLFAHGPEIAHPQAALDRLLQP